MNILENYTFQALPDLGSLLRNPSSSIAVVQASLQPNDVASFAAAHSALRAAFARILLLYLDSREFLFAELKDGNYYPFLARITHDGLAWPDFVDSLSPSTAPISLDDARAAFDLAKDQDPFPVLYRVGNTSDYQQPPRTLILSILPDNNDLWLSFDTHILGSSVAEMFLHQVLHTAKCIIADPSLCLNSPLSYPPHLLSSYVEHYDPTTASLSTTWLKRNAQERPSAVAHEIYSSLSKSPELLTFKDLNQRSSQFARWLCGHGVQMETMVAVCRHRDAHFYVAHAAIFKSGGCYVSIDPELPPERKSFIVQNSNALFVLTTQDLAPLFGDKALVLEDSALQSAISSLDDSEFDRSDLDSLAYLLYTSGTTGNPKGCLLMHRGLYWAISSIASLPRALTNPETDKRLAMASIAFDVHLSEILQSWYLALRLVSAPRFELLADLQENIERLGITHLGMVPSMIEATLTKGRGELPLKYLVSGGEKVSEAVLKKWSANASKSSSNPKPFLLANFYGPTEATIGCTSHVITINSRSSNIGKPFLGARADVVAPGTLDPVPLGALGELVIWGPLVGRGYLGLDKETKKAFILPGNGERGYRTGDLVRMMPDHSLEIHGRIDTQIKLRGVRIESEGVSSVLCSSVEDIEVEVFTLIAVHSSNKSEQLVAFVSPAPSASPKSYSVNHRRTHLPSISRTCVSSWDTLVRKMKEAAQRELPTYMRPSFIVPVDFMPLNLNGKTDSKALKLVFESLDMSSLISLQGEDEPFALRTTTSPKREDRPPTGVERQVIDIVTKVTPSRMAQTITVGSNLFELGLDSIRFAKLAKELSRECGESAQSITVAQLMAHPTIEDVASVFDPSSSLSLSNPAWDASEYLEQFRHEHSGLVDQAFGLDVVDSILPPFPVQGGILFQATQTESRGQYVQHFVYRVIDPANVTKLKRTWEQLLDKVEILRVCFLLEDDLLQVVLKPGKVSLPWNHQVLDEETTQDVEAFIEYFSQDDATSICRDINDDITKPMFRVTVYSSPTDQRAYHVLSLSHAVYDGNSVPLLMNAFDLLYNHDHASNASISSSIPFKRILSSIPPPYDPKMLEFWKSTLSSIKPEHHHKFIRPTDSIMEKSIKVLDCSLLDVQRCCERLRITAQALFIVAYALSLREMEMFKHEESVPVFGVIRNGRSLPCTGADEVICPLVSIIPTFIPGRLENPTIVELLVSAQQYINDTTPYEHVSLGQLHRYVGMKEIVDTLFSCRYFTPKRESRALDHVWSSSAVPEFALALELLLRPHDDSVEARVGYTPADISLSEIDTLLHCLDENIALLIGDVEKHIHLGRAAWKSVSSVPSDTDSTHNTEQENELLRLISMHMNLDQAILRPTTSFVSIGLSSLNAVGLAGFLSSQGSLGHVNALDIIQTDSVRALSLAIGQQASGASGDKSAGYLRDLKSQLAEELGDVRISDDDVVQVTGCTSLQAGMLSQTLGSGGKLYVHGFTFKLEDSCIISRLKEAWRQAVDELDILRTSFHFAPRAGRWAQVIHSNPHFKWEDEPSCGTLDFASELIATLDFSEETTLHRPPIFLYHVVHGEQNYLIVIMHHALYDGVGARLLFDRVEGLYHDAPRREPSRFLPVADEILFREFEGISFWKHRLTGCHTWKFTRKNSRSDVKAWRASCEVTVAQPDLRRLCRRYHLHPQCLGQVAWSKVLAVHSSTTDVIFGHVASGRLLPGASEVVGPVFNTIPFRMRVGPSATNLDLLRAAQQWNSDALKWQHASLRDIQRALGISQICDSLFLFQPLLRSDSDDYPRAWANVSGRTSQEGQTQYAVNIEMHELESGFRFHASCSADVMSHEDLVDLLDQVNVFLSELVSSPAKPALPETFVPDPHSDESSTVACSDDLEHTFDGVDWSEEQRILCDIIGRFANLDTKALSPSATLNSFGIDSISSIQIASMARGSGIRISPSVLVNSRSLGEVLSSISTHTLKETSEARFEIPSGLAKAALALLPPSVHPRIERFLPVTSGMAWNIGGWYASGGQDFKHAFAYRFTKSEEQRIRAAWDALCERHEILRANFLSLSNDSTELVMYTLKPPFDHWIERSIPARENDLDAVRKMAHDLCRSPIAPGTPQTRAALMRGNSQSYLIVTLHHMQYDAWSLRILTNDFKRLCANKTPVAAHRCDELFSVVQNANGLRSRRDHWRKELGPAFRPDLFQPRSTWWFSSWFSQPPKVASIVSSLVSWLCHPFSALRKRRCKIYHLFSGRLNDLEANASSIGVSLNYFLLACWAKVQASFSSSSGATFALSLAGRSLPVQNIDTLAFPAYNILPIHVPHLEDTPLEVANRIQDILRSRTPEVEQTLLSDIGKFVGLPRKPLCNVYVNVVKLPPLAQSHLEGSPAPVKLEYVPRQWGKPIPGSPLPEFSTDLIVEIIFNPSSKSITLSFESSLINEVTMDSLASEWEKLVEQTISV